MTDFESAERLREHRPLLLACEAIGWLHMAGKARMDFLQGHGGAGTDYKYEEWHKNEAPPFPWHDRLQWVPEKFPLDTNAWPGVLTEFIEKHTKNGPGLLGLLQAGHAMASGIEKNLPKNASKYLGQDAEHMWLSSAIGHPVRNLLADPPELLTDAGWKALLEEIKKLLSGLERLGGPNASNDTVGWRRWRDGAVGPEGWLRKAFTGTLAETRLPNNDVTLFDQSYVAAALFKSAAAGAILEGEKFPWKTKENGKEKPNDRLKQQTRWRLLTVGMGAEHYEARAVKIGDWTGARLALDEFFDKVRKLVEADLAVGSLLYRDGEVCVFTFPGERFDHDGQGYQGGDLQISTWQDWLAEQMDGFACDAGFETPPYCHISEPSRSLVGMTGEIRKARTAMAAPLHRFWQIPGQDAADGGHVCPVCLVRNSGKGTDKQAPCGSCRERRTHRLKKWLEGPLGADTIWISEVADANDRVALVTMSQDIEPWLDGTRLDSLRTQAIPEWRKFNPLLNGQTKPNPIDTAQCFDSLSTYIKDKLSSFDKKDPVLSSLQDGYQHETEWPSFFSKIVEDRADAPQWDDLDESKRAAWLTHQLFRKLASPGRIYRFERQAEEFFRELRKEFREIAAADQNRWRVRRLLLKTDETFWKDGEPYAGRFKDKPLDLLCRKDLGGFITIGNLGRVLDEAHGREQLTGETIPLTGDDNKEAAPLKIKTVEDAPGYLGEYCPVIPLELSPVRFRVLLPLEAASACVDLAVARWKEQFARVWDRLPLRVGVVAFPRKTPFQAVIQAARNMEDDLDRPGTAETWRVTECDTREGVTALTLQPPGYPREILQTIPVTLPGGREDVFYPYLAVEDTEVRFPRDFKHPDGRVFRHAKDLRGGDGVRVYPARIATLFTDGTAQRFEPSHCRPLTEWLRMRGLWGLVDRHAASQTAVHGAWSELADKRDDWQGPEGAWPEGGETAWLDLARAVFHQRLGVRGACLEELVQAAGDGLLDWSLDWHMSILKMKVSGGE